MAGTGPDEQWCLLRFSDLLERRSLGDPGDRPLVVFDHAAAILADFNAQALDATERAQAGRFRHRVDAESYLAAHYLARAVLATTLDVDAAALRFIRPLGKKPRLAGWSLDFSLSHSKGWVAVAVCRNGLVGVDVEAQKPLSFWTEIEQSFIAGTDSCIAPSKNDRWRALKLWTAKEAALKASGHGLSIPPRLVPVDIRDDTYSARVGGAVFRGFFHALDADHLLAAAINDEPRPG